ncbi:MAG: hypothetical protein FJ404_10245 [Verrucomicrobia bacterium]|nr:hypothetical protein [Verrucomicrobiota bacterium]
MTASANASKTSPPSETASLNRGAGDLIALLAARARSTVGSMELPRGPVGNAVGILAIDKDLALYRVGGAVGVLEGSDPPSTAVALEEIWAVTTLPISDPSLIENTSVAQEIASRVLRLTCAGACSWIGWDSPGRPSSTSILGPHDSSKVDHGPRPPGADAVPPDDRTDPETECAALSDCFQSWGIPCAGQPASAILRSWNLQTSAIYVAARLSDPAHATPPWFKDEGDVILVLGGTATGADQSTGDAGRISSLREVVRGLIHGGRVKSAALIGRGGLAAALAEGVTRCLAPPSSSSSAGARVDLAAWAGSDSADAADAILFGEWPARALVTTDALSGGLLAAQARILGMEAHVIGTVGGGILEISGLSAPLRWSLDALWAASSPPSPGLDYEATKQTPVPSEPQP